jgi:hypothetical protein
MMGVLGSIVFQFPIFFWSFFLALFVTYLVKLQKIVSRTDQSPLASYFLQPSQKKLPESASLLDLSEHRLNYTFSSRVNGGSHLGLQLTLHPLHATGIFR